MCASHAHNHAAAHERAVGRAVSRALAEGTDNFHGLLAATQGADPATVVATLERAAAADDASARAARAAICEAHKPLPEPPTPLPIAHPLDYAWMFSEPTQVQLIERIAALTVPGELVVHLGTPMLHERAMHDLPDREHVLFDRDQRRIDAANASAAGSAQRVDLLHSAPAALGAALAVADPPWYPGPALAFTHAASALLRAGAQLLIAFPAALTRPGISEERRRLLAAAENAGMTLVATETSALLYDTPAFERAAMTARGLPGVPPVWRVGDLITLTRTSQSVSSPRFKQEQDWLAAEIGSIPLRARPSSQPSGAQLIGELVPGDILATVSGRAPERNRAALWTSRNRIYRSADPHKLARLLNALAAGSPPPNDPTLRSSAKLINEIVALERSEHGLPARDALLIA